MMTLRQFLDHLAVLANASGDAPIRINGEYVHSCAVQLSHPLVETPNDHGMRELSPDKMRPSVVDIAANGRDIPDLPITIIR